MVKAGYEVTIHSTQDREDAMQKVKNEAKNYDLVICSGGDGTLDEAVTGMMQSEKKVPLGYIPAGSTNDFANSLKRRMWRWKEENSRSMSAISMGIPLST